MRSRCKQTVGKKGLLRNSTKRNFNSSFSVSMRRKSRRKGTSCSSRSNAFSKSCWRSNKSSSASRRSEKSKNARSACTRNKFNRRKKESDCASRRSKQSKNAWNASGNRSSRNSLRNSNF